MMLTITGHRRKKLDENGYNGIWIRDTIYKVIDELRQTNNMIGYVGMADGVDLIFCGVCGFMSIPYIACIPFDEQDEYMSDEDKWFRGTCLKAAKEIKKIKNYWMVEKTDIAICVWD